jgi:hypothetical protein
MAPRYRRFRTRADTLTAGSYGRPRMARLPEEDFLIVSFVLEGRRLSSESEGVRTVYVENAT